MAGWRKPYIGPSPALLSGERLLSGAKGVDMSENSGAEPKMR
jgi:hypothetical protein